MVVASSNAASLAGCVSPRRSPSTCPTRGCTTAATLAKANGTTKPSRWCSSRRPRSSPTAYTPATMKPTTMNAPTHMWANCSHTPSLNIARHGWTSTTSPVGGEPEAGRVVHPGVDRHDAEGADHPGDAHRHQHQQVLTRRHPAPAVEVDAEEDRLDEERQPLEGERQPEHVAEAAHQPRPEHSHLEAEHRAGHGTDGEEHGRDLRPALGEHQRDRVVAHDAAAVHHEDHRREGDAEAGQDDVPSEREGHLLAGREETRRLGGRGHGGDELDQVRAGAGHEIDDTPGTALVKVFTKSLRSTPTGRRTAPGATRPEAGDHSPDGSPVPGPRISEGVAVGRLHSIAWR